MILKGQYNGWANYQTWNVALWIGNDEPMYTWAVEFMHTYHGKHPYNAFIRHVGLQDSRTPDGIHYLSSKLNYSELDNMIKDLI